MVVDAGIELMIEPERTGLTPEQVRELTDGVLMLYSRIRSNEE